MSSSIQRRIGSVLLLAAGAVLGAIAALAFGTTEFHDREREAESIAAQPTPPLTSTIETAAVDASSEDRAASPPSVTTHFLCGVKVPNRRLPQSRKHTEVATEPPIEPIRGHTVNQQGEPVAGVVIWASPPPRPIPPRPTTGRAVAARQAALQSELDATALQAERMIEVRSEADGSFTIPIRENAPHTLEARARGYSVQPLCAPQEAVFPGESVELVLCPLVAVPVDVRFSTDAQAPFAMIQCHRFAAPNMSELFFEEPWRAEDSVLYLGAGRWEIRAKHDRLDGGDVEVSEQCPLTLTDGVPHEPVRLSLRPMIGIRGSVRASGENTLPALHLVLAAGSEADPQTPLIDTGRPQCYIAGETRSAAFEFLDLNPGLYTLHVYYDTSNARATSLQIIVKDRLEVADLTIPSPALASGRRVRVLSDSNVGAFEVGELRRNPEDGLSVEIDPEPVSENTYEYERVPPGVITISCSPDTAC